MPNCFVTNELNHLCLVTGFRGCIDSFVGYLPVVGAPSARRSYRSNVGFSAQLDRYCTMHRYERCEKACSDLPTDSQSPFLQACDAPNFDSYAYCRSYESVNLAIASLRLFDLEVFQIFVAGPSSGAWSVKRVLASFSGWRCQP